MTNQDLIAKIKEYQSLLEIAEEVKRALVKDIKEETGREGVLNPGWYSESACNEIQCEKRLILRLAEGNEVSMETFDAADSQFPFKASVKIGEFKMFTIGTAEEMEEIKKATCTVAE